MSVLGQCVGPNGISLGHYLLWVFIFVLAKFTLDLVIKSCTRAEALGPFVVGFHYIVVVVSVKGIKEVMNL